MNQAGAATATMLTGS
ncbi:MAG: hypothetical protein C4570_01040 [Ammonifex sp.]|nr:MAG: hypothetical protein C4570_01040 [Ammonifex sp.]